MLVWNKPGLWGSVMGFSLRTQTIKRGDVSLIVSEASSVMKGHYLELSRQAGEVENAAESYLYVKEFIFIKSVLVDCVGFPDGYSFEEYKDAPEEFNNRAFNAVVELNPHWFERVSGPEDEEKKSGNPQTSTGG